MDLDLEAIALNILAGCPAQAVSEQNGLDASDYFIQNTEASPEAVINPAYLSAVIDTTQKLQILTKVLKGANDVSGDVICSELIDDMDAFLFKLQRSNYTTNDSDSEDSTAGMRGASKPNRRKKKHKKIVMPAGLITDQTSNVDSTQASNVLAPTDIQASGDAINGENGGDDLVRGSGYDSDDSVDSDDSECENFQQLPAYYSSAAEALADFEKGILGDNVELSTTLGGDADNPIVISSSEGESDSEEIIHIPNAGERLRRQKSRTRIPLVTVKDEPNPLPNEDDPMSAREESVTVQPFVVSDPMDLEIAEIVELLHSTTVKKPQSIEDQCRERIKDRLDFIIDKIRDNTSNVVSDIAVYMRQLQPLTIKCVARALLMYQIFVSWPKDLLSSTRKARKAFDISVITYSPENQTQVEKAFVAFGKFLTHDFGAKPPTNIMDKKKSADSMISATSCLMETTTAHSAITCLYSAFKLFGIVPTNQLFKDLKLRDIDYIIKAKSSEMGANYPYRKRPLTFASLSNACFLLSKMTPTTMESLGELAYIFTMALGGSRASSLIATTTVVGSNPGIKLADVSFEIHTPKGYINEQIRKMQESLNGTTSSGGGSADNCPTPAKRSRSEADMVQFNDETDDMNLSLDLDCMIIDQNDQEPWKSTLFQKAVQLGFITYTDVKVVLNIIIRKDKGTKDKQWSRTITSSSFNAIGPYNIAHVLLLYCFASGHLEQSSLHEVFCTSKATTRPDMAEMNLFYRYEQNGAPKSHVPIARDEPIFDRLATKLKIPRSIISGRAVRQGLALMIASHYKNENPSMTFQTLVEHVMEKGNWRSCVAKRYLMDLGLNKETDLIVNKSPTAIADWQNHMLKRDVLNIVLLPAYREQYDKTVEYVKTDGDRLLAGLDWYQTQKKKNYDDVEEQLLKLYTLLFAKSRYFKQSEPFLNGKGLLDIRLSKNKIKRSKLGKANQKVLLGHLDELVLTRKRQYDRERHVLKCLLDSMLLVVFNEFEKNPPRVKQPCLKNWRFNLAQLGEAFDRRGISIEGPLRGYAHSYSNYDSMQCPYKHCEVFFIREDTSDVLSFIKSLKQHREVDQTEGTLPFQMFDLHLIHAHGDGKRMPKSGFSCKKCGETTNVSREQIRRHHEDKHWAAYKMCYDCTDKLCAETREQFDRGDTSFMPSLPNELPSTVGKWSVIPRRCLKSHEADDDEHTRIYRCYEWEYFEWPVAKTKNSYSVMGDPCEFCARVGCISLASVVQQFLTVETITSLIRNHPVYLRFKRQNPNAVIQMSSEDIAKYLCRVIRDMSGKEFDQTSLRCIWRTVHNLLKSSEIPPSGQAAPSSSNSTGPAGAPTA